MKDGAWRVFKGWCFYDGLNHGFYRGMPAFSATHRGQAGPLLADDDVGVRVSQRGWFIRK